MYFNWYLILKPRGHEILSPFQQKSLRLEDKKHIIFIEIQKKVGALSEKEQLNTTGKKRYYKLNW